MPTLLIAYDLAQPKAETPGLADAIMALGTQWARPLAMLWYVETVRSAADVEALLSELVAIDDGLLVQQVIGTAALANTMLRWTPGRSKQTAGCGTVIAWPTHAHRIAEAA